MATGVGMSAWSPIVMWATFGGWFLAGTPPASGYFVSISDQTPPWMKTPDGYFLINWVRGDILQILRASHGVRINERGVQFVRFGRVRRVGWESVPCLPDPTSLCRTEGGSRFFPLDHAGVAGNVSQVEVAVRGIAETGCSGERSGRLLREPSGTYDVSLCDVVDSGLDVFWDGGRMFYRRMVTNLWLYVAMSIVSVYLVSVIAQNLTALLVDAKAEPESQEGRWVWVTRTAEVSVVGAVLGLAVVPLMVGDTLLLEEEMAYVWFMVGYVVVHFAFMTCKVKFDRENRRRHFLTFNLITGVLLLLTMAIYKTMANPYVGILLVMLAMRSFYKLLDVFLTDWRRSGLGLLGLYLEVAVMVMDIVAVLFTHYVGFRRTFMFGFDGDTSFVMVCLFSWFISRFVIKD